LLPLSLVGSAAANVTCFCCKDGMAAVVHVRSQVNRIVRHKQ
jgi:hypothetical protein